MIRILGYLGKLDNDISIYTNFPKEVLRVIAMNLDCKQIGLLYKMTSGSSQDLEVALREKVQADTGRVLLNYNQNQLGRLCVMMKPKHIQSGLFASFIINNKGEVYSCGINDVHRLGLSNADDINVFSLVEIRERIIQVSKWNFVFVIFE